MSKGKEALRHEAAGLLLLVPPAAAPGGILRSVDVLCCGRAPAPAAEGVGFRQRASGGEALIECLGGRVRVRRRRRGQLRRARRIHRGVASRGQRVVAVVVEFLNAFSK